MGIITNNKETLILSAMLLTLPTYLTSEQTKENVYSIPNQYQFGNTIESWKENSFNNTEIYKISSSSNNYSESQMLGVLSTFAENIINNSKDIEPEFNQIVNDYFWDLL